MFVIESGFLAYCCFIAIIISVENKPIYGNSLVGLTFFLYPSPPLSSSNFIMSFLDLLEKLKRHFRF
jgi:hypothetical protein